MGLTHQYLMYVQQAKEINFTTVHCATKNWIRNMRLYIFNVLVLQYKLNLFIFLLYIIKSFLFKYRKCLVSLWGMNTTAPQSLVIHVDIMILNE